MLIFFISWYFSQTVLSIFIKGCHFMSRHPSIYKKTNNVPAGQCDLKTAKSVSLSLWPTKLSKLQHGWTTAEKMMARTQTAAQGEELIRFWNISATTSNSKGKVETRSFCLGRAAVSHRSCDVLLSLSTSLHFCLSCLNPCNVFSPFTHSLLLFPIFIILFLVKSFQKWCRQCCQQRAAGVAPWKYSSALSRTNAGCVPHARRGLAKSCRALAGLNQTSGTWQTVPMGEQLLQHCQPYQDYQGPASKSCSSWKS